MYCLEQQEISNCYTKNNNKGTKILEYSLIHACLQHWVFGKIRLAVSIS